MAQNGYYLSSSPHFSMKLSTQKIMLCVILSLIPECISGIVFFGFRSLLVILTAVLSALASEALFQLCTKQKITVNNLSAALSGLLLALVCPPTIPLWMVCLGSFVAMVIAKGLFGGIGSNVFNPALTGRAFLVISFPAVMGASWLNPLSTTKTAGTIAGAVGDTLADSASAASDALSSLADASASGALDALSSATILSKVKAGTLENFDFMGYFLGSRAGCIGETSILLILISFLFLFIMHIVDWRAPLSMVATFSVCTFFAGLSKGLSLAGQDVLIGLLTGGIIFGAAFMVTDYATTPVTKPGRLVFGFGCGLITFLIRKFGTYPEGVMFSILIMNTVAPFLNNLTVRSYGYGKKGNRKPDVSKITMEFDLKNARAQDISPSISENSSVNKEKEEGNDE